MKIKLLKELSSAEREKLQIFLKEYQSKILLYHLIEFNKVIDEVFRYKNLSLVAFNQHNQVVGFLPQWQKGKVIESVPWRDKGGPIYLDESALLGFINETKKIVHQANLKGFIWKDFQTSYLDNYSYFVNIEIDLSKYTVDSYWRKLSSKIRRAIRKAEKNKLVFKEETEKALESFYKLFVFNRKQLGVPVYPIRLFKAFLKYMGDRQVKIFIVYKNNSPIASLFFIHTHYKAVYAYPASNDIGKKLNANDMLVYYTIKYCIENDIKVFDFGADSPLQKGLIRFKSKWLGKQREIITSFYGKVKEIDHNLPKYRFIRKIIKKMPRKFYLTFSKVVVR